ncbi:MAG: hypothetical protein AABX70_07635 [Nanoarchaeota archaeon]
MTASPEVRQLAEKLHAQGICQTMASAFQMAESMLVTSVKVTRDFNVRYEKEDKKPVRPSLVGLPPTVAGMFDEPKDPLADPKDEPKDPDEEDDPAHEEEKVSTIINPMSHPHIEKPKPLFHAPPTSGMTLHELMDSGNGELRYDGSKVHYSEQKMPEQSTLFVESTPQVQMPQMHEQPQVSAPISAHMESSHMEIPKPFEAPKPVEAPQESTIELPKAPVQASRAELEKKNALYQKVDLSSVFGVKK